MSFRCIAERLQLKVFKYAKAMKNTRIERVNYKEHKETYILFLGHLQTKWL